MRMYKEIDSHDIYEILVDCLGNEASYVLADLIYDFLDSCYGNEIEETTIYDIIRFEMEIQTKEEILDNYSNLIDDDDDTEEDDFIEDLLNNHTMFIGSYEEDDDETFYVFTSF